MVEIRKITKTYGKRVIFNKFSYKFPKTGLMILLGESGSGKSTLLNIIAGLDNEYSGDVFINGENITKLSNKKNAQFRIKHIGYVFQNFNLLNLATVFENVYLPLDNISKGKRYIKTKRTKDVLRLVGIENLSKNHVNKLSGGEKQRTAIARALINNPEVILCDEPTGALDEKNTVYIANLLEDIAKNRLVIVATHDSETFLKIADEVININDFKITKNKRSVKEVNDKNLLIGFGKTKRRARTSTRFKVRFAFQKIKAKKFRSIILNFLLSLSLTGVGLSLIIGGSVSTRVEDAFRTILNGNQVIVGLKNDNVKSFTNTYSTSYKNVDEIYRKYQNILDGVGVNYLVNYEDFFKDSNNFYLEGQSKKMQISSLSARNINDFKFKKNSSDGVVFYPFDFEELDDDQVILGLSYSDMMNLCFKLQIQRNYTSLGHYIYEHGLMLSFDVKNNEWQYDDEQLLNVVAVCESNVTSIFHTNSLWNEAVFEKMMRLPSDDDETHEFPWEMQKIYYLLTKSDPSSFLDTIIFDDDMNDYIFEKANSFYNPSLCKSGDVCEEKRVYVYSSDKQFLKGSIINKYKEFNTDFDNFYFTSDFGYSSFSNNLLSGFSRNVFISKNEQLINDAIDSETQLKNESNLTVDLPENIVQGNYLNSLGNGLRFSTDFSKLIEGREPSNLNEIVISRGLAEKLKNPYDFDGNYIEFAAENNESYDSEGRICKSYKKVRLLVVGIVDESKNYVYHLSNWTISFFRDKIGVSNFLLIPRSAILEFSSKTEAEKAYKKLIEIVREYKVVSPIDDLRGNIDSTLDYANTILKVFSILSVSISILLLGTIMMLNIIESKNDINLFRYLGISQSDIKSFFTTQSVVQGLISFVISSIELFTVDFTLSYLLGNMLNSGFKFVLSYKPIIIIFGISFIIPFLISKVMLLILGSKKYA